MRQYFKVFTSISASIILFMSLLFFSYQSIKAEEKKDFYPKQATIWTFDDSWHFYYKNANGHTKELISWQSQFSEAPIVYNNKLYIRAGSLINQFNHGITINENEKKIIIYHPFYKNEGKETLSYDDSSQKKQEKNQTNTEIITESDIENLSKLSDSDTIGDIIHTSSVLYGCTVLAKDIISMKNDEDYPSWYEFINECQSILDTEKERFDRLKNKNHKGIDIYLSLTKEAKNRFDVVAQTRKEDDYWEFIHAFNRHVKAARKLVGDDY